MSLINCPECKKEVSNKANSCPSCGYKIKKKTGCLTYIGYGIIVIFVLIIIEMATSKPNKSNRDFQSERLAYNLAKDEIKLRLKSPATAEFPGLFESKNHVKSLGGGRFEINSWVDSQNGFGAKIRSNFKCVMKCSSTSCSVESVNMK